MQVSVHKKTKTDTRTRIDRSNREQDPPPHLTLVIDIHTKSERSCCIKSERSC